MPVTFQTELQLCSLESRPRLATLGHLFKKKTLAWALGNRHPPHLWQWPGHELWLCGPSSRNCSRIREACPGGVSPLQDGFQKPESRIRTGTASQGSDRAAAAANMSAEAIVLKTFDHFELPWQELHAVSCKRYHHCNLGH